MDHLESAESRFWPRVAVGGPEECWLWNGSRTPDGYGQITVGSARDGTAARVHPHRLAWVLANGEIPDGLHVCHACDNPPCCNPQHLWIGTHADNMHDMISKGRKGTRTGRCLGETNGRAKLTEREVEEIRARRPAETQRALAAEYGVSQSHIGAIEHGRRWAQTAKAETGS